MKKIQCFDDDLLGLSAFADRLSTFIAVERQYVPGSLVLSLDGRFGLGKTTFLGMWKASIESRAEGERPKIVLLNAWTSDFLGDPLSAIVASIEDALGSQTPGVAGIVEAAKDIGRFAIAIGGQFVTKQTGIDFASAGNYAQGHRNDGLAATNDEPYSAYKRRAAALENLKIAIGQFAADAHDGILILVDELDRCRPD